MTHKTKPEYVFEMPIKVRDYEVDAEGIVNNAVYLHYLEHTRHEFCDGEGFSFRQMRAENLAPVVTQINISYRRSLGLGDSMVSKLALERRGPLIVFYQDIFNMAGELVVEAQVSIATVVDGKLTRGDEIVAHFKKFL